MRQRQFSRFDFDMGVRDMKRYRTPEQMLIREMLEALKYSRRFLTSTDHDTAFVDAAIAKAERHAHAG